MTGDIKQTAQQFEQPGKAAAESNGSAGQMWQEAYGHKDTTPKSCAPSPNYMAFIDTALRESYSPQLFGDAKKVRHEFDCQIHTANDVLNYAQQVLQRAGDSHTKILTPKQNDAFAAQSDPSYIGLGMLTTFDASRSTPGNEHGLAVYRTYPGSPAAEAGLKVGDRIVSINSQDVSKLSANDAQNKIQGAVDSVAHLAVERGGKTLQIDATRKVFDVPSVTDATLPNGLAYISIEDFRNEHVADQLRAALLRHGDAKGFVFDVRDNGGGNVDLATLSLSQTLKDGTLMKTRERDVADSKHVNYILGDYELTPKGIVVYNRPEKVQNVFKLGNTGETVAFTDKQKTRAELQDRMQNLVGDRPVVVLTNSDTASAAEIFTGAERDSGHARLVGTTTYGKGIGGFYTQKGLPFGAGEVVTNMHWFTPSGFWVGDAEQHKIGLKPDVEVKDQYGSIPLTASDVQLQAAEADLANTLKNRH